MGKRKKYNVPAETFVRAWQSSRSAAEVARKVRMPRARVHSRACFYRRLGVALKQFERCQPRKLDVARLNAVAAC